MKLRRVAIIFNPKGGSARVNAAAELASCFAGKEVVATPTTAEPGSATMLAREARSRQADLVVAMGGDGTACQVAEGLMGSDVPMSVFPQGTGNLFARAFYPVPTAQQFAQMVDTGLPQPIDMIRLNYDDLTGRSHSRMFMVALGVGKLSDAVSQTSVTLKRWFGKLAYSVRVSAAALRPAAQQFTLTSRGVVRKEKAATIMVLNVLPPSMGFMSPGCSASDGMMDVGVIAATNPWQMLKLGVCALFSNPQWSGYYRRFRTPELVLECDEPVNPNIDGDPSHLTRKLQLAMVPGAVRMVLAA